MSENTLSYAMGRMGYKGVATPHGFRALASTTLNEEGFDPDIIERQLAHAERNKVRAAYHRAEYLDERRKLMQWWADFLDAQQGVNVRPVNFKRA
ncbi:tyrosine-type recombinase/integrase [Vogesella fluminis]